MIREICVYASSDAREKNAHAAELWTDEEDKEETNKNAGNAAATLVDGSDALYTTVNEGEFSKASGGLGAAPR